MTDTLTFVGEETIEGVLPGVVAPLVAAEADLDAKIAAYASFQPVAVLPMTAQLEIAQNIVVGFQECISLGIEPPSLAVQISLVADALAAARLQLAGIEALFGLLATAGVDLYAYSGTAAGAGAQITTAWASGLPGGIGSEPINALILATRLSATWAAIGEVFKVSP